MIALKMRISLLHSNCVRFECDKLHFIALKAHFTFIVGISIYQKRCLKGLSPYLLNHDWKIVRHCLAICLVL